jgi:hypothetical protein
MVANANLTIPAPLPKLDFMRTISRELTHKRRIENVYVTSIDQQSDTQFVCGAYLPQANVYLNEMRAGPNDVTLTIIEIARQMGIAVCHKHLGVDHNNIFILNTMRFEELPAFGEVDWSDVHSLHASFTVTNQVRRADGMLSVVHATSDFFIGEAAVCRLYSDWSIQSKESGKRLREISRVRNLRAAANYDDKPPPFQGFRIMPVCPVKRSLLNHNLWVSQSGKRFAATIEVDMGNLFFFDHENDHVPGMLLVEGMRELAMDLGMRFARANKSMPQIQQLDNSFTNYAELDHPVVLVADVEEKLDESQPLQIAITVTQFGKAIAEGRFIVG